ncbi:hypothetical protein [Acuticoccus yangtzensis]|uniref:hypothetical protein n=1 Tax=Acuticoccus yangtzensis TaxID=1443441 RepID=UPI000B23AF7E|nr:hypothetical protein [Acuticoccus yangtzensis]
MMKRLATSLCLVAGLAAAPFGAAVLAAPPVVTETALADTIRGAIEARDYDAMEELVFWKDAGTIKKRIVAFQIRSGLGRKVASLTVEPFDQHVLDRMLADGRHTLNLPVSHIVRVVYDEPAVDATGKPPTSVFLAGRKDDAFRIALVVRNFDEDDDD